MRILLLFIYFTISTMAMSQSCGITFWSQAEIDSFPSDYPECTEIPGLLLDTDVFTSSP